MGLQSEDMGTKDTLKQAVGEKGQTEMKKVGKTGGEARRDSKVSPTSGFVKLRDSVLPGEAHSSSLTPISQRLVFRCYLKKECSDLPAKF